MTKILLPLLLALALLAPPCRAGGFRVEYDKAVDLSVYETFGWMDGDEDLRDSDPELHRVLVALIRDRFAESGLRPRESDPDLRFSYVTAEKEVIHFYTRHLGSPLMGTHRTSTEERKVSVGTLILEIEDASDGSLVWRATGSSILSRKNAETNLKKIDKIVRKMAKSWAKVYGR